MRDQSEESRDPSFGDELLEAVQQVRTTVGTQLGRRLGGKRVAPRLRLRERVGGQHLSGGELRKVLLLLRVGAVVDERQRADAGVRAPGDAERRALGRA